MERRSPVRRVSRNLNASRAEGRRSGAMRGCAARSHAPPQKTLRDIVTVLHDNLRPLGGLVAQLVEQCPFKALVQGSSPCQPTTFEKMAWVYILHGDSGRHYIGSTNKLKRRLHEHRHGQTHSTKRLGDNLEIMAVVELVTIDEARALEREMKRKKNPRLALALLQSRVR